MKRILVFSLALILAVSSMVVPSYAAELETGQWIELLDYGQVTDTGNFFSFNSYKKVSLTTPQTSLLYSADILFYLSNSTLNSIRIEWGGTYQELTVVSLGGDMYRAYGDVKIRNYSDFNIEFNTSGVTNVNIFSCKVSQVPVSSFTMNAAGYLSAGSDWNDLYYTGQGGVSTRINLSNADSTDFTSGVRFDNWKYYDFIELHISLAGVASITSLSAYMVNEDGDPLGYNVPIDISYISNSFYNDGVYDILIQLDLRGLDRTDPYFPVLDIYGEHGYSYVDFGIYGVIGYIFADTESSSDYFLRRIYATVSTGFDSVGQWFLNLGSTITSGFDSVIQYFSEDFWPDLVNQYQLIKNILSSGFNSVVASITDGFDSILQFWSIDFWNSLVNQYKLIKNVISSGFQNLINILNSSGNNEQFDNDVAQQGDKLDDMAGIMDSVQKPDLGSINTDLSGIVSPADTANIAQVYTMVIGDGFVGQIMTMVVIMAMMSFVLFGKR